MADAGALVEFLGTGMIVAGPRGLPASLLACLRERFVEAAADPVVQSAARKARRTLDVARGDAAQRELLSAERHAARFARAVAAATGKARE